MTTNSDKTQELTDKINESITTLCAETDAAKQNETYRAWLNTLSHFYSYSFNNWLLIYTQRPDASRVAGFQTWKSLGRFVKKGERGIRIFAPIIRKVEEERNGATEQVSHPVGFRSIAVFERLSRDLRPGFHALDTARDLPQGDSHGCHVIAKFMLPGERNFPRAHGFHKDVATYCPPVQQKAHYKRHVLRVAICLKQFDF